MASMFGRLQRRSTCRAFGVLTIAAVVFILLQIFALKVLTGSGGVGISIHHISVKGSNRRSLEHGLEQSLVELKAGYQKLLGLKGPRIHHLAKVSLNATLGVKPALRNRYVPDESGMFTCLQTKTVIEFSKVNDDYCDCEDASDEPGTAACSHSTLSRFYCNFQISDVDVLVMSSTRVNDGICDCCDGSDEWGGVVVPPQSRVKDSDPKTYSVFQAPCYDRCDDLREMREEKRRQQIEGRKIKQEYLKFAEGQSNPNKLYGPNGEFLKLQSMCLSYTAGEFEYNICPFSAVRQQAFPHSLKTLGREPVWVVQGVDGVWKLRLGAGDRDLCPGGVHRQVMIEFTCGTKEEVTQLSEQEKCRYEVQMRTPAAC